MANERKGEHTQRPSPRRAGARDRSERREAEDEKEMDRREDDGWTQPESSAQKGAGEPRGEGEGGET
jgi:hypothetical protein